MLTIVDAKVKESGKDGAVYAGELVRSMRTVATLGFEPLALDRYEPFLTKHSPVLFVWALVFCFVTLISGTQIAAAMFNYVPEATSAMLAASEMKSILEREPLIMENGANKVITTHTSEKQGLDLEAHAGQTIALVGSSGCGKSTILSLIERFYDPVAEIIRVGNNDIKYYDLGQYRNIISLVSQEPFMFRGTRRENIAIGLPNDSVSDNDILEVSKQSNLFNFLSSISEGLDTNVGPFGNMLSGGQKQRVAIARAMLSIPAYYFLMSLQQPLMSLPSIVQYALDKASVNRTTVISAHRLRTIQHADMIYVMESGRVVEKGTHAELIKNGGYYSCLLQFQDLS
ncbi:multidrug resistance protein 4 [Nemania serpens]|nr:multidrug resistance protein 4 [Nemania serpens]